MQKTLSIMLAFLLMLSLAVAMPVGADAAAVKLNASDVTLYALDDTFAEYISIPDEYPQSFQLSVSGARWVSYDSDYSSVQVSESGLITPAVTTFYWYGSVGYSFPRSDMEPTRITRSVRYGVFSVYVYAGAQEFEVKVTVKDYAQVYADNVMKDYLSEHITPSMTTYEKLSVIGEFIGSYEYSVDYQSPAGMIITGGGDCWASANTVVAMADMLGLEAWQRNGNRDPGAGSGHMNAMVYDGERYYEVEAGYYAPSPRPYDIKERDSLFSYFFDFSSDGIEVYQYDGRDIPALLTIPDSINGHPVTAIGENFLVMETDVRAVVLPDSVRRIGDSAFNSCTGLQSINLPESLSELGSFVFTNCDALTDIRPGGDYTVADGAVYHGDVLLYAPAVSALTIPSGVTEIAPYAFYCNDNVTSVTVPETVRTIGEGAFGDCSNLTSLHILGEGLKEIGGFAVASSGLREWAIPAGADTFDENMMTYASETVLIVAPDSPAEAFAEAHGIPFRYPRIGILGDVDGDEKVTILDATAIQRRLAAMTTESYNESAADADGDGKVTVLDATAIQRYLASLKTNPNIAEPMS